MGAQLLQDIYLFKEFQPKELEELSAKGSVKTYNRDDVIFSEGEKGQSLFVIRHGTVHIRTSGKKDNVDVVQLGTGAHLGEMPFVNDEPRSATAVALERSELLEIGYDALQAHLDKHPATAVKFYRALAHFLAGRLRATTLDLSFSREKNLRHF
jgi:CRP/FNR family transcriptional regulator, cyclic AMP receptor protein